MDGKVFKDKQIRRRVDWERLIKLDKIESKTIIKMKKGINRGKRSKTLSKVKPAQNISKNPQTFLEISPVQKELLPSHKVQEHSYE